MDKLTNLQRIQRRRSEVRSRLTELSGVEAPTPEQDAETATLETEYNRLEVRERAAIISETDNGDAPTPSDTGADAELRSIH